MPNIPTRSNSRLSGGPPTDAQKPDSDAIEDVLTEVQETGDIHRAARNLSRKSSVSSLVSPTGNGNGEAGAMAAVLTGLPTMTKLGMGAGRGGFDDPEEMGYRAQYEEDDEEMEEYDEYEEEEEVVHLQEVVDGLWIGDLVAAMDTEGLQSRGITNILSLLRPSLKFPPQFAHYPLEIDDSETTDILTHLPSVVAWIQQALATRSESNGHPGSDTEKTSSRPGVISSIAQPVKKGGVLVHCQAGMSRSATAVAAYLMQTLVLDPMEAVEMIKEKRPVVDPSNTFWHQLGVFYNGDGKVSLKDRSTRQFYMERTAAEVMNGNGGPPPLDKMAKYPATPTPSNPPTPSGGHGRRKIRCKMCRRHLAVREHMMDHILDQSPVSRPRTPSLISLPSPRTSFSTTISGPEAMSQIRRRPSIVSDVINPLTGLPGATTRSRQPSMSSVSSSPATMMEKEKEKENGQSQLSPGVPLPRTTTPGLILTSSSPEALTQQKITAESSSTPSLPRSNTGPPAPNSRHIFDADTLASRLPPHLLALRSMSTPQSSSGFLPSPIASSPPSSPERESPMSTVSMGGISPSASISGLAASSTGPGAGVKAANRRLSMLALTPASRTGSRERRGSVEASPGGAGFGGGGPPILVNPKCSGYFVEPLTWMNPVLQNGEIAGKIICPNEKCGAKIGSFDWAGVQCGCKEWVTPGFCIHRSKVDEVW